MKSAIAFERDDQSARAAELLPETLVVLVGGIVLRDPGAEVVVDVGDVGVRARTQSAPSMMTAAEREAGSGRGSRASLSGALTLRPVRARDGVKSASVRPTL